MVTEVKAGSFETFARIDLATNTVTDRISLGYSAGSVAVHAGDLWIAAPEDGTVVGEHTRQAVVAKVKGLARPAFLAAGEDAVWVLSGTCRPSKRRWVRRAYRPRDQRGVGPDQARRDARTRQ
jgi:hypothetical protein